MIWPIDMGVGPMSSIYDSFLKGGKRTTFCPMKNALLSMLYNIKTNIIVVD